MGYGLSLREDVSEVPGAQHIPQGGGRQQPGQIIEGPVLDLEGMLPGRPAVVVHVGHGADGVLHLIRKQFLYLLWTFSEAYQQYLVVHYCIDEDCHRILGQNLAAEFGQF